MPPERHTDETLWRIAAVWALALYPSPSHCMMQGLPPRVVMAWAVPSSLAMLERDSHPSPEHGVDHIDRLAPQPSPSPQRPQRVGNTSGNTFEAHRQDLSQRRHPVGGTGIEPATSAV